MTIRKILIAMTLLLCQPAFALIDAVETNDAPSPPSGSTHYSLVGEDQKRPAVMRPDRKLLTSYSVSGEPPRVSARRRHYVEFTRRPR